MSDVTPTDIVGACPAVSQAVHTARQFSATTVPVLLVGATGTGKDLMAQRIHRWSGRPGPLVDVNCGALPQDLADGLLFGHRRGAYTGAFETVGGLIESASDGTLFLDELESLPLAAQVKLLRVLESGEVRRLGDAAKRQVDFRIIATAKGDLRGRIQSGAFRLDLYQRVAGVVVVLPRLMDRGTDVIRIAHHFIERHGLQLKDGASEVLTDYEWPGNVRELRSAIDRAAFMSNGSGITASLLAEAIALGMPPSDRCEEDRPTHSCCGNGYHDRRALLNALSSNGWHGGRTAQALGIARSTLFRKLKSLGISLQAARQESDKSH